MKGLVATLLVVTLAFAGCAGKSDTTTTSAAKAATTAPTALATSSTASTAGTTTTHASTSTGTTSPSSSGTASENHPPTVATFSASRPNATTLHFTFAFTGSDPDGDTLTWTLDANGDGTQDLHGDLPGNAAYVYPAAGFYNATLVVSDGKLSETRLLAVNATLGLGAPLQAISLKWTLGSIACAAYPYNPSALAGGDPTTFKHGTPAAGVLWGEAAVPANYAGHTFTVDAGTGFGAGGNTVDSVIISFYDTADAYLGSAATPGGAGGDPTVTPPAAFVITGPIPDTSAWVTALNCANPQGLTLTMQVA